MRPDSMDSTPGLRALAPVLGPLASAGDECLVFDLGGRLLGLNAAARATLGLPEAELDGCAAWELLTCLTAAGFARLVAAARTDGPQTLLGHLRCARGALRASETRLWLAELDGTPHVLALARELRGRTEVLEERDHLASLVHGSSEMVVLFDPDLRATYANPAAATQLGIARADDVPGLTLAELVPPERRAWIEEEVIAHLTRQGWAGELELRSWRDPRARTRLSATLSEVRDTRRARRSGYALVAHDESARSLAEARRQRLLALAETSRRVALHLLAAHDLNAAVAEVLTGIARVLGVRRAHLHRFREGGRWLLRTHEWTPEHGTRHERGGPSDLGENYRWATEVLERGEVLRVTPGARGGPLRGLLDPGDRALLLLPVRIQGRLESLFGFVHEEERPWEEDEVAAAQLIVEAFARGVEQAIAVREREQALAQLERAVEAEKRANAYKSEFLASMSHELRTPMNAIRGYAELLARGTADRALEELWLRNLRRSSEYLLGLVHDVLDLSKIEAGHMQPERQPTALAEVLAGVEDLLAPLAREKSLDFAVVLEGPCPATFESDPTRLKQILLNLAGNAIKFTARGSVRIRVRACAADALELVVQDTGSGIPAEAMERLFQPFTQVNQRAGGTGLGLKISRSLARLLGGDVTAESTVGAGSTFTLRLPLRGAEGTLLALPPRSEPAREPARELPASLRGRRILVVDDSLENREVLRFLLEEAGAQCTAAGDGREGVERARAAQREGQPFDAVLMDMNMPIVDGFEATRALVAAGVESPVIALTALALAGDEERCRAAGCVAYVTKPIVPSVFFDTLARHVRPAATVTSPPPADDAPGRVLSLAQHPRFRALVERYVGSFAEQAAHLSALAARDELDEVRTLVHRLRGTAASFGFPAISQAAGECEDAIRAGAPRLEIQRVLDALLARLTLAAAG
ncbi:MAG TPA: ATP-binding protein [Planctomycetota bacterium]